MMDADHLKAIIKGSDGAISNDMLVFTVFTPTFNRLHTLQRVYDSLSKQTFRNFEWLIIDDGSIDQTEDAVRRWIQEAVLDIRYVKQQNLGKHVAHNRAVDEARGQFFVVLDSDDECTENALECLLKGWNSIPEKSRDLFCGVGALCVDQNQHLVGDRFPSDAFDSSILDAFYRFHIRGEKWGFVRTEIMKKFPFPEEPCLRFVPEGVVWNRIGQRYLMRFINEPLRIYHIDPDRSGQSLTQKKWSQDQARGRYLYCVSLLNEHTNYLRFAPIEFVKASALLPLFARSAGISYLQLWRDLSSNTAKALVSFCLPLAGILTCAVWLTKRG